MAPEVMQPTGQRHRHIGIAVLGVPEHV